MKLNNPGFEARVFDLKDYLENIEKTILLNTLSRWPKSHEHGARHLNLLRTTYIMKLKKYGLYKRIRKQK